MDIEKITQEYIVTLCNIILIYDEQLDMKEAEKYIEKYIDGNIHIEADKYSIRQIVQKEISNYIKNAEYIQQLFTFANDNSFQRFHILFRNYYDYYWAKQKKEALNEVYPIEFEYVFEFIYEFNDSFTIYQNLSSRLSEDAIERAVQQAKTASEAAENASNAAKASLSEAQNAVKMATVAAKNAEESALNSATTAAEMAAQEVLSKTKTDATLVAKRALRQALEEKKVDERIDENINKQMNRVTEKISETSVTMLGMFSGIVLTVVAGLFYSSSAIESASSSNFYKLIVVSALIGYVCINLFAVMFCFIERIKTGDKSDGIDAYFKNTTSKISTTLLTIMCLFTLLQFILPDKTAHELYKDYVSTEITHTVDDQSTEKVNDDIETTENINIDTDTEVIIDKKT